MNATTLKLNEYLIIDRLLKGDFISLEWLVQDIQPSPAKAVLSLIDKDLICIGTAKEDDKTYKFLNIYDHKQEKRLITYYTELKEELKGAKDAESL
ncbi:hypothetical protein [Campylobacter fetus]|uniref:hypothetical protein n=1 Tax=Campylobacter fetus TaxID=196 RepID=UPI000FCAD65A|nr:hypothetical protein [Campylobacter fetus]RUT48873.1 hypothetical protein BWK67_09025 [Campylobacter fetus]RUT48995.1 hypothetical protein BWK51_09000 [Campylobacter fetus]